MILILIALLVAMIVVIALLIYGNDGYDGRHLIASGFGIVLGILTGISSLVYALTYWEWLAAEHSAQIINREYGTHYTREEVFFSSDVIDKIREIQRQRVEINGDLLREKDTKDKP